jgi:hypothetical protein
MAGISRPHSSLESRTSGALVLLSRVMENNRLVRLGKEFRLRPNMFHVPLLEYPRWSQERAHTTKSLINDMLCRLDLSAFEASHLQATREALEKAEVELSLVNRYQNHPW